MSSIKFRLRGSFLAVLAVGLVWIGCTDNRADLTSPADLGPNILVVDQVALSHAIRVQEAHTDEMFEIAGVVGTGVGLTADGRPVVKIFTREAGVAGLPESLEDVPVAVEVTGMIFALTDPTARQPRPVPIGVSTGHPDITAGTIGARVKDVAGNVYALSNNHVYANQNDADIGDSALQPGPFDGGTEPDDVIGTLADFEPINFDGSDNMIDAAIAVSSTGMLGNATPSDDGYGTPSATLAAGSLGLAVKKYGRTTKLTFGEVSEINVTVNVCYDGRGRVCFKSARFVEQIAIKDGTFSKGGDSGSLIVTDDDNNNPVGLLFAGSSTRTIANRIDLVLSRFGVTIDDAAPAPAPTLSSISVTPASASIEEGQTQQFTATGNFDDGSTADLTSTATWASSNTGVATIDASGLATGVLAGTTNITASQDPVTSDAVTLEVTTPPPAPTLSSISVTPASASIEEGQTQQFTATGNFDDGSTADLTSTATWGSSNTGVATIDASGLARGVSAGNASITASQDPVTSNAASLDVTASTGTDDVVTINKAEYNSKAGRLRVEAESDDATAVLTAYNHNTDDVLGVLVDGKLNIRISLSPEVVVRVESDKGGSATEPVQFK